MQERSFRVQLRGPARRFYERAPSTVQDRLDAILLSLQRDPFVDHLTKFDYTGMLPVVATAYADAEFRIIYQLVSHDAPTWTEWVIDVWAIRPASADM